MRQQPNANDPISMPPPPPPLVIKNWQSVAIYPVRWHGDARKYDISTSWCVDKQNVGALPNKSAKCYNVSSTPYVYMAVREKGTAWTIVLGPLSWDIHLGYLRMCAEPSHTECNLVGPPLQLVTWHPSHMSPALPCRIPTSLS